VLATLKSIYCSIRRQIESRLQDFETIRETGSDEDLFVELAFCLLTPQSKARTCWKAVELLLAGDTLFHGCADDIRDKIHIVRFKNKKSKYITEARDFFTRNERLIVRSPLMALRNVHQKREWLVHRIKGMGYKEASHFLRNIGFGDGIAILDRHILKNMKALGIINSIPGSISARQYIETEARLMSFSKDIAIPLNHLDFVFWFKETGDIFK